MTVAEEFAAWAGRLRLADVPAPARHAACRHLLDGVGTALAAARTGAAAPAVSVAQGLAGPPEARILGGRTPVGAPAAALATGALVHALDFDDTHAGGLVHATAAVLPAALAVGQQVGADGAAVLEAALVGYEAVCRVGAASPHGFHARGLHATAVCGPLAAAAVTSRLLGLDAATTTHAWGVAGSSAGGLLEFLDTGAATKQLHPGTAGHAGIVAARLAAAGATGPESVVEGRRGVYATMSARPADVAGVTRGLGTDWEVTAITVKPYPACQLMHAALDAVAALGPLDPALVESVEVEVHPDSAEVVCEPRATKLAPRSPYDAKFSLPWSIAALLLDGGVGVDTYRTDSVARPDVAALAARVHHVVVDSPGPAADAPGRVVARLRGGGVVEAAVAGSAGGPAHPLTDAALTAKFLGNAGGPSPLAGELADRLLHLADEPSLDRILDLAADLAHNPADGSRTEGSTP